MYIDDKPAILLLVGAILTTSFITTQPAQAETGKGDDIFRGEASKVRFLDSDTAAGGGIIEYVATFPNVTVNAGGQYDACVLPVKILEPICTSGNNSPAARPEFVDLSLNATTRPENGLPEDAGVEEGEE
jgi:hypothetical protein